MSDHINLLTRARNLLSHPTAWSTENAESRHRLSEEIATELERMRLAAAALTQRSYRIETSAWGMGSKYFCNQCRQQFRSEHSAKLHDCPERLALETGVSA